MTWPLSQDYNEAIQNPATAFADADLKAGTVAVNVLGLPVPRSGNFADVYQMSGADGKSWALKCFTRQVAGLEERYARIDEHLRQANLPFNVGFRFQPEGIRVRGKWYPLLKMEWVEGLTLNEFVRQNLTKTANLESLFQIWLRLSKRLRDADIAHADLQHGNVLLVPGAKAATLGLKLIDYDGMWVPALADKPSGELGHPSYQHPQRLKERIYTKQVDRFPHLVIGTALLSLIVGGPDLWKKFDNGDNMLFRETDLRAPEQSVLVKTLWALGNKTLCSLLGQLALASWRPLNQSAWLDELMSSPHALALNPKQEREIASRLGVEPLTKPAVAAVAMPSETPNVFADLTAELPPSPRSQRSEEQSPALLYWLIGGAAAVLVLVVLGGIVAVALLSGSGSRPTQAVVQNTEPVEIPATTEPPTAATPPTTAATPTKPVDAPPKTTPVAPPEPPPPAPKDDRPVLIWSTPGKAQTSGLDFTPDGQFLVAVPGDASKWLRYDVGPEAPKPKEFLEASVPRFVQVHALSDSSVLTVSEDNSLNRWYIVLGNPAPKTIDNKGGDTVRPVAVSPTAMEGVTLDPEFWRVNRFNLTSGRRLDTIEDRDHERAIFAGYSPNGKQLAVVCRDFVVSIVTIAKKSIDFDLKNDPSRSVRRVAFSPDGNQLVGFGGDALIVWDLITGLPQLYRPGVPVNDAVFTRDGRILFVGDDRRLHVWDTKTQREKPPIKLPQAATCVRVSPDGQFAATASGDGDEAAIQLWRLAAPPPSLLPAPKWPYTDDDVGQVEASDDLGAPIRKVRIGGAGATILVATTDGKVRVLDAKMLKQISEFRIAPADVPSALEVLSATQILAGQRGQMPKVWDVADGKPLRDFPVPATLSDGAKTGFKRVDVSADGKVLLDFADDAPVLNWDVPTGRLIRAHTPFKEAATVEVALRPDGLRFLAASNAGELAVFDATTGQRVFTFPTIAPEPIARLVYSLDGKIAAGGGAKGRIWIWNAETGALLRTSNKFDGEVKDLALTADGQRLVAVSEAPDVLVYDVAAGEELRSFTLRQGALSVTLTPDGKYAVTAGPDNVVRVWRLP